MQHGMLVVAGINMLFPVCYDGRDERIDVQKIASNSEEGWEVKACFLWLS